MTDGSPWKELKLSLERPYKDDEGHPIPVLLDITPDGEFIYEPKEDYYAIVGDNLRRIFVERGLDFFEKRHKQRKVEPTIEEMRDKSSLEEKRHVMDADELLKMRMEVLPQLYIALGEMSQARDLLALLLSSPNIPQVAPNSGSQPSALTVTVVTKQPAIPSVQAFNAQLAAGGKDQALRNAADLFKFAADRMETGRVMAEKYWVDALKIRTGNWGLIPAPLPFGSATGKGADKTSKDFLVSFGLEESPPLFRRRAIARMSMQDNRVSALEFPSRQNTRLQVTVTTTDGRGVRHTTQNRMVLFDGSSVGQSLHAARAEVVEQEIFSALIREASHLPTASARVSERLIVIEAAQATDLQFELVDKDPSQSKACAGDGDAICDLISGLLHILLLRTHAYLKSERLGMSIHRAPAPPSVVHTPPLLQPIIDMLQYRVFCERVHGELDKISDALSQACVPTRSHFEAVGGTGEEFLMSFRQGKAKPVGGEARLRVDNRSTLRFTFFAPSSLIAHLPQATLPITSIPQLTQLLADEVRQCLLARICEIGSELCSHVKGMWFVDMLTGRSVGRWEGCVLT
ncbi:subunit 17 of mediator complex-domain-containing protein [Sparassis latifolia]